MGSFQGKALFSYKKSEREGEREEKEMGEEMMCSGGKKVCKCRNYKMSSLQIPDGFGDQI